MATYLITMSMSANSDWLSPTRDKTRNGLADDGFSEDCATKDVSDGTIRTQPHFLQLEFCREYTGKKNK